MKQGFSRCQFAQLRKLRWIPFEDRTEALLSAIFREAVVPGVRLNLHRKPLLPPREALMHERAALGSVEMRPVAARRRHECAHFLETLRVKPAVGPPALDGGAVGFDLIWPDFLMCAFVAEYPKLHRCR
jgi:hypothetical protein